VSVDADLVQLSVERGDRCVMSFDGALAGVDGSRTFLLVLCD
jgi:hypothetical protein